MVSAEKKVVIIDEGTGRPMPDRHWRDGLHQAVEAKEKVPINMPSDHAAQVTYQNFYRLYKKLGRHERDADAELLGAAARCTGGG